MACNRRIAVLGAALAASATLLACSDASSTDFSMGTAMAVSAEPSNRFAVGVGDSARKVLAKNGYLKKHDFKTVGVLRLQLDTTGTQVAYDDGDLKLEVCAEGVTADGEAATVDVVGIRHCQSFVDDFGKAVSLASQLLSNFERANPEAKDLKSWYRAASQRQLEEFEGQPVNKSWDLFQPVTDLQARVKFGALLEQVRSADTSDSNSFDSSALLGVYEGERTIFELSVDSAKNLGGSGLTPDQERQTRFSISMRFRKKPYAGSITSR